MLFRPKRFYHWNTSVSEDQDFPLGSTGYMLATKTVKQSSSTMCSLSTSTPLAELDFTEHSVTVASKGKLIFEPNKIDAHVGDVIRFSFLALNHTLTQSSFSEPCTNLGGFSTGFNQFNPMNVSGQFVVEYRVDNVDPQWFFCAQTLRISHCHAGMVFALNAGGKLSAFISEATGNLASTTNSIKTGYLTTTSIDPMSSSDMTSTTTSAERGTIGTSAAWSSTTVSSLPTSQALLSSNLLLASTQTLISHTTSLQNVSVTMASPGVSQTPFNSSLGVRTKDRMAVTVSWLLFLTALFLQRL